MRIEMMPLSELLARKHLKNPKEHALDALDDSFTRFGFTAAPTIDETSGVMVAGHGRCLALEARRARGVAPPKGIEERGTEWYVPVVRDVSFENDNERDAYVIADNQHVIAGGWNFDALTAMLGDLDSYEGLGFEPADLSAFGIGATIGGDDEDAASGPHASSSDSNEHGSNVKAAISAETEASETTHAIEVHVFDDDAVADATFAHYRAAGFPYPNPGIHECMLEINRLASMPIDALIRSNVAYGVADKYQRHRFEASAEKKFSPMYSFTNDDQLRRAIDLSMKYDGSLTDGAIRGVISLVRNTQACANFRPGFAAYLYRRFCPPGGVVLDTSTGYGGRLVGALASTVVSHYIGIDPNAPTVAGNRKLLSALGRSSFATLIESPAEDVEHALVANKCDFAFTSPPYFRKEHYSEDETQNPEVDAWRTCFLQPMMRLQFAALKPGSIAIVNIADVLLDNVRHPLAQWTKDAAQLAGFVSESTLEFPMARRFGSNQKDEVAVEPVLVFRKR